jgi:sulfonate transport system ATP-binding protein
MSEPSSVLLRGVHKSYVSGQRSVRALDDVSLAVEASEVVAIVGPSGCGKSTLLRLVAGLEAADRGEVLVGGRAVNGPESRCGMMFQEHRLFPWLTTLENVAFGLRGSDATGRAERAVRRVGLSGFEEAYPHQLSGGMAQRAALARALAPEPRVLLLDEPFGALDAFTKVRLQEELVRSRAVTPATSIVVTHDVEEALFLSDRVVVLSERPGTVRCTVNVPLRFPRDRTSPEFVRLRREVLAAFAPNDAAEPEPQSGEHAAIALPLPLPLRNEAR